MINHKLCLYTYLHTHTYLKICFLKYLFATLFIILSSTKDISQYTILKLRPKYLHRFS